VKNPLIYFKVSPQKNFPPNFFGKIWYYYKDKDTKGKILRVSRTFILKKIFSQFFLAKIWKFFFI